MKHYSIQTLPPSQGGYLLTLLQDDRTVGKRIFDTPLEALRYGQRYALTRSYRRALPFIIKLGIAFIIASFLMLAFL